MSTQSTAILIPNQKYISENFVGIKIDTASKFDADNPITKEGVLYIEKDTGKAKLGDGRTNYSKIPYNLVRQYNDRYIQGSCQINAFDSCLCNTKDAGFVITLPYEPSDMDRICLVDLYGTFRKNSVILDGHGKKIQDQLKKVELDIPRYYELIFNKLTDSWYFIMY